MKNASCYWLDISEEGNPSGKRLLPVLCLLLQGVLDRETNTVHLFERADRTAKATDVGQLDLDDPKLPGLITEELHEQLLEDVEMLDG